MINSWKEHTLGEIVEYRKGFAFKSKDYMSRGRGIVKVSNFTDSSINIAACNYIEEALAKDYAAYELLPLDVIIATVGSWPSNPDSVVGKVVQVPQSCDGFLLNQNAVRLRANSKSNQKFLFYLLRDKAFFNHTISGARGSANQASITLEQIFNFKFDLPDLPTQTTIAEILSSLDDKIELNNQINKNLEALAQVLFKQWFIDFEFPNENDQPYKSSGGEMVESELGMIPKGWRVGVLSEIIEINPTERLPKGTEASYIDMAALPTQGSWPDKPIQRLIGSGMKFRNGDTLLARITPCLENGKTGFIQCLEENEIAWGSTEFIVMRPKEPWPKEFGYLIARSDDFRTYAIQNMVGTSGRQRVDSKLLSNYQIVYPTDNRLPKSFGEILASIFHRIKVSSEENQNLSSMLNILLPKLISGELEVSEKRN